MKNIPEQFNHIGDIFYSLFLHERMNSCVKLLSFIDQLVEVPGAARVYM